MEKQFYAGTWQRQRAFSPAVATRGGRIIWVAGHGATHDASGRPLDGDFDGQVRQVFANLAATLERAGGTLADIVTMTVFISDVRYGDRFVDIRKEFFANEQFPASALITVAGFANPAMMVEIQCVAVAAE
ncbi:MAG TPA: RidA family protein [Alphaproteobacteria bacterium]|nr:RidA family protein [Alphaproteobacteria bacterium]